MEYVAEVCSLYAQEWSISAIAVSTVAATAKPSANISKEFLSNAPFPGGPSFKTGSL